jgi:AAA+ superfamily predicted ATPase
MDKYANQIRTLILAGCTVIQVVSYEWQRVHGFINEVAVDLERKWFVWNSAKGLSEWDFEKTTLIERKNDLHEVNEFLQYFNEYDSSADDNGPAIFIAEDIHPYLTTDYPDYIRIIKEFCHLDMSANKNLILCQPIKRIPTELLKELPIIEIELPTKKQLGVIFDAVVDIYLNDPKYEIDESNISKSDELISTALGLTTMEAKIAFSKALIETKSLNESSINYIIQEKENIIKKSGQLEYYHPEVNLNEVGGLDILKGWLNRRGKAFRKGAQDFGLDTPRGVLLLGVPGCGKSLSAKAVANAWNFPLLRFDLSKVYGSMVGESEQNIRNALNITKALAPCVLWIDEIEKGLAGIQSSNQTDSGVSARVFGTFLTWMQEKKEPVFVVATSNDISALPPELLRKGRFDEIFFVDLPTKAERKDIFTIHLKKKKREPINFNLDKLVKESNQFTGAEIEEAVKEGLYRAFDNNDQLKTEHIVEAIKDTTPLAITMGNIIQELRKWAKFRAKFASSNSMESPEALSPEKTKEIPKIQQEVKNPFIKSD